MGRRFRARCPSPSLHGSLSVLAVVSCLRAGYQCPPQAMNNLMHGPEGIVDARTRLHVCGELRHRALERRKVLGNPMGQSTRFNACRRPYRGIEVTALNARFE